MDDTEFDEFYTGSRRRLTAQLYAMIGDAEEAADCVQEAFVRAWARRGQLDRVQHPEAWVRTTAYRLAISRWRRLQKRRRFDDRAVAPPTEAPPASAEHVELVDALRTVSEPLRVALVLHHIVDLPVAEVAAELGVPVGTVKARLSRGRAALAAALAESADHVEDAALGGAVRNGGESRA